MYSPKPLLIGLPTITRWDRILVNEYITPSDVIRALFVLTVGVSLKNR